MTLAGFLDFVIAIVGLAIIVGLIWAAMEFRPLPEPYRKFARMAVGGAAFLAFAYAIRGVLVGGGALVGVTIGGIFEFAIGVILLYLLLLVIDWAIDFFQVPFGDPIKFGLTVVALVIILGLAATALTHGGLGFINLGGGQRPLLPALGR